MDENLKRQLESLELDPADEIEARSRIARRRRVIIFGGMTVAEAIVIAAVILVVGTWGGKIAYDHYQAKQLERALMELSNAFKHSMQDSSARTQQMLENANRQQAAQVEQRRRQELAQERAKQEALEQRSREQRLSSDQCRFWDDQLRTNPTERNEQMVSRYCG